MKRTALMIFSALMAMNLFAEEYTYLIIEDASGNKTDLAVASGITLTPGSTYLKTVNGSTTGQLTLTDLTKMYFGTATGISQVSLSETSAVEVFSASGISMGTFPSVADAKSRLKGGVYLIKQDKATKKCVF